MLMTPMLRRLVDQGRIDEILPAQCQILHHANEDALLDLSIAVMRAEDPGHHLIDRPDLASRRRLN
jgi:hypothetical protein